MAGTLNFDRALCYTNAKVLRLDRIVAGFGRIDPFVDDGWLRRWNPHIGAQCRQLPRRFADDLLQGRASGFEIVARGNFLRDGKVKARLRFVRIDNRRGADFKIALRLRQLLGDRSLGGDRNGQTVGGCQHVKISLNSAHDQILPGLRKYRFGLRDLQFALLVGLPVLPAKQRLGQGDAVTVVIEKTINRRHPGSTRRDIGAIGLAVHAGVDGRQQRGQSLWILFEPGIEGVTCRRINGVVGHGLFVNAEQIGTPRADGASGASGGKQPAQNRQQRGIQRSFHCKFLK